jgi:hypothetical protein
MQEENLGLERDKSNHSPSGTFLIYPKSLPRFAPGRDLLESKGSSRSENVDLTVWDRCWKEWRKILAIFNSNYSKNGEKNGENLAIFNSNYSKNGENLAIFNSNYSKNGEKFLAIFNSNYSKNGENFLAIFNSNYCSVFRYKNYNRIGFSRKRQFYAVHNIDP